MNTGVGSYKSNSNLVTLVKLVKQMERWMPPDQIWQLPSLLLNRIAGVMDSR
jgi:hypothetical protein